MALLGLLEGESAKKTIGTWRKGAKSSVEVDFVLDAPALGMKIPIECKAALGVRRRHAESGIEYLTATHQSLGVVVSVAPLGLIHRGNARAVINIPVYLATKDNILRYTEAHLA